MKTLFALLFTCLFFVGCSCPCKNSCPCDKQCQCGDNCECVDCPADCTK